MLLLFYSYCFIFFFFFFSSRRRHTRFDCDWSSDVCSSDLASRKALRLAIASATAAPALPRRQCFCGMSWRSEEHTSELQSQSNLVCRLLLEKKKKTQTRSSDRMQPTTNSKAPCDSVTSVRP